jgi:hypothetical protein
MELHVELERAEVALADPDDCRRLALRVVGPGDAGPATHLHRLGDVLSGLGLGRLTGGGDALLAPEALRFWAAGQVADDWEHRFVAMADVAASKGWLDPTDGALQAHVVWPAP